MISSRCSLCTLNATNVQIGTNRGRKALFTPDSNPSLSPVEFAPMSTVTGIYVAIVCNLLYQYVVAAEADDRTSSQGQGLSFQHLGLISESLHKI